MFPQPVSVSSSSSTDDCVAITGLGISVAPSANVTLFRLAASGDGAVAEPITDFGSGEADVFRFSAPSGEVAGPAAAFGSGEASASWFSESLGEVAAPVFGSGEARAFVGEVAVSVAASGSGAAGASAGGGDVAAPATAWDSDGIRVVGLEG